MVDIQCGKVIFSNVRAILFDKDGTLVDSEDFLRNLGRKRSRLLDAQIPGAGDSLLVACGLDGNTLDPTGLLAVGSRRENEIAAAVYVAETGRGWLESLEVARKAFDDADRMLKDAAPSPLFVGCWETLEKLSRAGLKLGIVSADTTSGVREFVARHQLKPYIQLEMGVDCGPSKPDPSLFVDACQALEVEPSQTLMVGDSPLDIEMGKRADAAGCIGICWDKPAANRFKIADVTIAQLDEIQVLS
ncbi:MAG: HAD family hydrolase [Geitlerinemataceae cyanobacterium]